MIYSFSVSELWTNENRKRLIFATIRLNETMNKKTLRVDNSMSYIRTQLICKIQSLNNEN
jgi:hypothetical protein